MRPPATRPGALRRSIHACRALLRQSSDAQPSAETRTLYADLLAGRDPRSAQEYADEVLDGDVTIMFTDIEDSTPLAERLGDDRWTDVLEDMTRSSARRCARTAAAR